MWSCLVLLTALVGGCVTNRNTVLLTIDSDHDLGQIASLRITTAGNEASAALWRVGRSKPPAVDGSLQVDDSIRGDIHIGGSLSVADVAGVATFSDLTIDTQGPYRALRADANGVFQVESATFGVVSPTWPRRPPRSLTVSRWPDPSVRPKPVSRSARRLGFHHRPNTSALGCNLPGWGKMCQDRIPAAHTNKNPCRTQ